MSILTVTYPDVERAVVDILAELLEPHEPDATVGVGVPAGWTSGSPTHVQVDADTANVADHPVLVRVPVRFVVRAASTTEAKRVANLAFALACGYTGGAVVSAIQPVAGVLAARDADTDAELASVTVRALARSIPVPSP
jgi:hypothetical protein